MDYIDLYSAFITKSKTKDIKQNIIKQYSIVLDNIKDVKNIEPQTVYDHLIKNFSKQTVSTKMSKISSLVGIHTGSYKNENGWVLSTEHNLWNDFKNNLENQQKVDNNNRIIIDYKLYDGIRTFNTFLLSLYMNYPPLRKDFLDVKLANYNEQDDNYYKDGILFFNKLNKNKGRKIQIKLNIFDVNYIKGLTTEYMIDFKNFDKQLKKASKTVLGKELTIVDFRRLYTTKLFNDISHLDTKNIIDILLDKAYLMNTSIDVMSNSYFGKLKK